MLCQNRRYAGRSRKIVAEDLISKRKEQWQRTVAKNSGKEQWQRTVAKNSGKEQWQRTVAKNSGKEQWQRTVEQ